MTNRLKIEDKLDTMNDNLRKISLAIGGEISKPATWEEIRILCRNNKIRGLLEIGESIPFEKDGERWNAIVMDFIEDGQHSDGLKLRDGLQTGVIFQAEKIMYNLQFDEREAFYVAKNGLSSGTYNFTIGDHSWKADEVGKTYQFSLSNDIPSGSQLVWTQVYNATLNGSKINIFSNGNSTSIIESPILTEGSGGISLGIIKNTLNGDFNSCQRAIFGSNRYKNSALRQNLNSEKNIGEYWTAQDVFDRPPSWLNTIKGFLNGLQKDLKENIATIDRCVYRNTLTDGGGVDEFTEKIFLPSRNEMYFTQEGSDNTKAFAFYKDNSGQSAPFDAKNEFRIKNQKNGSPYYWWFESPNVSTASSVRSVTPTGACDSISAYSSRGVAPAFVIA